VPLQELLVDDSMEVLLVALLQDDLVEGGAVVDVIEIELAASAPGQHRWELDDSVGRPLRLIESVGDRVGPDLGIAEGSILVSAHVLILPDLVRRRPVDQQSGLIERVALS
jgi:hypothetical protein